MILSLGEVLWDLLPSGPQLGGAPANFACHALGLGAESHLASRVGTDGWGDEALRRLLDRGIGIGHVTRDAVRPTGTVAVELAADGQPRFEIAADVAWDAMSPAESAFRLAARADAICFGSLAQRSAASRQAIQALVAAAAPDALRIFDVNLRAPFYSEAVIVRSLELADVLKLNETELPVLANQFGLAGSAERQLEQLADRFGLRVVALTLGAEGCRVLCGGEWTVEPGRRIPVRDTVGAGDAFSAALTLGLLSGWPMQELAAAASDIAAHVCTQAGATPALPAALTIRFRRGR